MAGPDMNVAIGGRATRIPAGNPAECHLLARMGMKRTAHEIAHVAICVALAAWLSGCPKGTLGDPDAGGSGRIMGAGARGASGIGGAGASDGGIWSGFGGGAGGRAGTGGRGLIDCPAPLPPVCGALCGNGRIDSCTVARSPECIPYNLSEECDGDDLGGGATCAELGFPSGKLVCDKTCSVINGMGCSECVPMAPAVVSCGTIPPPAAPYISSYAIAATDLEVGLAEVGNSEVRGVTLSFRRLTPSLATASSTTLLDTLRPGPLAGAYVDGVAVAPIPSGWVIASCAAGQVYLFTVDAAGVNSTRTPVPVSDRGCGFSMVLAARPGGGPLLVWRAAYGLSAALIAADGQSAGTPFDVVPPATADAGAFDAAWVGDAFNVVVATFVPPDYNSALRLARIDANGTVTSRDLLVGGFEDVPRIARGATDTRITYAAPYQVYARDIMWRRVGSAGELLADALVAQSPYGYSVPSPAVAVGDDTLVLVADQQASSLSLARVGLDGQIRTRPYDILRAPSIGLANNDMIRRGPDAIVSWLSYNGAFPRVGLVRITP